MSQKPRDMAGETPCLLIVAAGQDADVVAFANACRDSGWAVAEAADVYLAMARLANASNSVSRVVVDSRAMSAAEKRFLDLAPRYFANISFHDLGEFVQHNGSAPSETQTHARVQERPQSFVRAEPRFATIEEPDAEPALEIKEPTPEPEPTEPIRPAAAMPLDDIPEGLDPEFTDDEAESQIDEAIHAQCLRVTHPEPAPPPPNNGAQPSLHEAVRQRMWADAAADGLRPRPVRRIPPATQRTVVEPQAPTIETNQGRAPLTPEELDALLSEFPDDQKDGAA